jgi:MazG family protein
MSSETREALDFARLLAIVRELRERCPWDREQTLESAGKFLIEEAYEVADAIERGKSRATAEELGDLLVQVLFAAVMAEQEARFDVAAMLQAAANKLVRRHPHVYANAEAQTADEVVAHWNRIKSEERKARGFGSALDGIALSLPALTRAQKLGARARQAGMDWADIHQVLAKVREEMDEVEGALARGDSDAAANELGDMLLALANAPRFIGHDAEQVLRRSCAKFVNRFRLVERLTEQRGLELERLTAAEVESLWQEAKNLDPKME